MDAPILEAVELTKTYSGLAAVSGVSFAIRAGDILGYLGPNGSGKSTTVKMLAGLLEPTSGRILFRGQRITDDLTAYKTQVGYVPEEAQLYPFLTGWEYLELVGTLREISPARLNEKAGSMLNDFVMYTHRHSPISSYSKGMRQRILLIAALLHDPKLLILDEPFSGLDIGMAIVFRQVIKALARHGKAIFFCSPVLEVVEKLCTHLVLLRRGSVVAFGAMEEIRAQGLQPALEQTFLQLTEDVDADRIAANIVAAAAAPCH
jgi:ABC-2 type transport system ATP-binding protein